MKIYFSNCPSTFPAIIAQELSGNSKKPLTPLHFVVEDFATEQWLIEALSQSLNTIANTRMRYWRTLSGELAELMQLAPTHSFEKRKLAWRIYDLLVDQKEVKPYWHDQASSEIKRWGLAKKISILFQDYQTYRVDWLKRWERGELLGLGKEEIWQSKLWQRLAIDTKNDNIPIFKQHEEILNTAMQKRSEMRRLFENHFGERFFVIITPEMLPICNILQAVDTFVDVHVFWLNPCKEYWGDSPRWWLEKSLGLESKTQLPPPECNPLLANWGQQSARLLDRLIGMTDSIEEYYRTPDDSKQLGYLKHTLLEDSPLQIEYVDDSLQIIETDSIVNEIELARQKIEIELAEDPSIALHECTIALANYEEYAPFISAVFHDVPHSTVHNSLDEVSVALLQLLDFMVSPGQLLWKWQVFLKSDSVLEKLNENLRETEPFTPKHIDDICEALFQIGVREGPLTGKDGLSGLDWDNAFSILTSSILKGDDLGSGKRLSGLVSLKKIPLLRSIFAYIEKLCAHYGQFNQIRDATHWNQYLTQVSQDAFSGKMNDLSLLLGKWQSESTSNHIHWEVAVQSLQDYALRDKLSASPRNNGGIRCAPLSMAHAIPSKIMVVLGAKNVDKSVWGEVDLMQKNPRIDDSTLMGTLTKQLINTILVAQKKLIFIRSRNHQSSLLMPIEQLVGKINKCPEKRKLASEYLETDCAITPRVKKVLKINRMFHVDKLVQFMQNPLRAYLSHQGIRDIYSTPKEVDRTKWEKDESKSAELMRIHDLLMHSPNEALEIRAKEQLVPDVEVLKKIFHNMEQWLKSRTNMQTTPLQKVRLSDWCCYGSDFCEDSENYWLITGATDLEAYIKTKADVWHNFLCATGEEKPMGVVLLREKNKKTIVFDSIDCKDAKQTLQEMCEKWQNGLNTPWHFYPKAYHQKQRKEQRQQGDFEHAVINALYGERGDMHDFSIKQLSKDRTIADILADI